MGIEKTGSGARMFGGAIHVREERPPVRGRCPSSARLIGCAPKAVGDAWLIPTRARRRATRLLVQRARGAARGTGRPTSRASARRPRPARSRRPSARTVQDAVDVDAEPLVVAEPRRHPARPARGDARTLMPPTALRVAGSRPLPGVTLRNITSPAGRGFHAGTQASRVRFASAQVRRRRHTGTLLRDTRSGPGIRGSGLSDGCRVSGTGKRVGRPSRCHWAGSGRRHPGRSAPGGPVPAEASSACRAAARRGRSGTWSGSATTVIDRVPA